MNLPDVFSAKSKNTDPPYMSINDHSSKIGAIKVLPSPVEMNAKTSGAKTPQDNKSDSK